MEAVARQEYTAVLVEFLFPPIYMGFRQMWFGAKQDAREKHEPRKIFYYFQKRLEYVAAWNQHVIDTEFKSICEKEEGCEAWLNKMIDIVFVANVKVLSSIRLQNELNTIPLSVPEAKVFVHRCYLNAARRFWVEYNLFDDRPTVSSAKQSANFVRAEDIIRSSIHAAIRDLLPLKAILNETLKEEMPHTKDPEGSESLFPKPDDDHLDAIEEQADRADALEEGDLDFDEGYHSEAESNSSGESNASTTGAGVEGQKHKADDTTEQFMKEPEGLLDDLPTGAPPVPPTRPPTPIAAPHLSPPAPLRSDSPAPVYAGVDDPFFDDD